MTDLTSRTGHALDLEQTLPALLRRAAVDTWLELPRVVALGLLSIAAAVPLVASVVFAPLWMSGLASLPLALLATGLARFAAVLARRQKPTLRDGLRFDPVLALSLSALGTAAALAIAAGGPVAIGGCVVAAAALVVAPYTLAYGAVRGRRGLSAWRGGGILVAFRPGGALTVLSLTLIGGFAVAATVGALAVIVPCIVTVFTCVLVAQLLATIDGATR